MAANTDKKPNVGSNTAFVVAEIAVIAAIFIADAKGFIPFSKTPFLLAFGWLSMRIHGVTWKSTGLRVYRNWQMTLALGLAAGGALEAIELFITQPVLTHLFHQPADLSTFNGLKGHLQPTLLFIGLAWTLAAFGEEMVYRGYLMNRVAGLFHGARRPWILSLILVHAVFGLAHAYQGVTGVVDEGLMGLLLGVIYLRTDRCLAVPIVAHGIQDTIDFFLIFSGHYPGM
ncbi:MAG TPA: CPBP family intramembrane glutamic endopeptidase [Fimbriimonas sp.]|nr:CPBP family intramembrane glutamic endopeptidase [Fimbriimonas sp.]